MNRSERRNRETDLTREILSNALDMLQTLSNADSDSKEHLWKEFIDKYPTLEAHLIPSNHHTDNLKDYELIFKQTSGNVVLQFCPDRGIPWLGRYLENMAENILVMVGDQSITFQSAFHWFRMSGYLDTLMEMSIDAAILTQSRMETAIRIDDEEIQHTADIFRKAHGLLTPEETHVWLEKNNMSIEEFQDFIQRVLLYKKTLHHITDGKTEPYFNTHKDEFDVALLAHIVVNNISLAHKLLDNIRQDPERWAALAREHSLDEDTSDTGGWLGLVSRSDLLPEIADTVFSTSAGNVVGPFNVKDGLEIIHVYDVRKAQLDDRTREKINEKIFRDWIAERRAKVDLHWYWYQK